MFTCGGYFRATFLTCPQYMKTITGDREGHSSTADRSCTCFVENKHQYQVDQRACSHFYAVFPLHGPSTACGARLFVVFLSILNSLELCML